VGLEGDALPTSLAGYYEALDAGRMDEAVAAFTADAVYAAPFAGGQEADARNVVTGHEALAEYFQRRGLLPYRHEVLFCAAERGDCLIEGVSVEVSTSKANKTFVASLQLGDGGRISRYLAYQCEPPVSPPPDKRSEAGAGTDAPALVDRYFTALAQGRFEDAAACFSLDTLYSHPPYRHTAITDNRRIAVNGRQALIELFRRRGPTTYGYRMDVILQRGSNAIFENAVVDLPGGGEGGSMGSLTIGPDGLIRRYAAFYCEPGIPRLQ
jgi:ketosteroid isomerase-like protein